MADSDFQREYTSSIPDEALLLSQMAEGSMDAFDQLYRYFQQKVYHYILPFTFNGELDANDIVQDIFVKLWAKREAISEIVSLEFYLYRMARNRLIDLKRSKDVLRLHLSQIAGSRNEATESTAHEMQFREFHKRAQMAIRDLPERRRLIFNLNINHDLSIKEIAERLNISVSVVKKQLYLATQFVRESIKDKELALLPLFLLLEFFLQSKN